MKNRAKCKNCKDIIESFHRTDYAHCQCHQISVYGGPDLMECSAMDWQNFLRVDDNGNEIQVTVQDGMKLQDNAEKDIPKYMKLQNNTKMEIPRANKKDMVNILDELIKHIDSLPQHVMSTPITHYDYQTLLLLLSSLFKVDLPEN